MEDAELDAFKREIDLRQFAASQGYEVDRRDSWRGSTVMRKGAEKIVIKRNSNGHYVYFSVRDDGDNGTIIDFVQKRRASSLGHVRLALREWTGKAASASLGSGTGQALPLFPALEPASKDRMHVETEYQRMSDAALHSYLETDRFIPAALLSSSRFAGRVRIDGRGNAVFPHFDQEGLCGYEIKNRGFTGFASGGEKGLWFSRTRAEDTGLVIAESAIDALSHAALFTDVADRTRYASIGGKTSPRQPGLMKAAFGKMADGSSVIAAFDADETGREMAGQVGELFQSLTAETGRKDLSFRVHLPSREGADWNDVLRDRGPSLPIARFEK
jgi:Toprim-like/Protein of unknown function (DUF3991)